MTEEKMASLTASARAVLDQEKRRPDGVNLPAARVFERLSRTLQLIPVGMAPPPPAAPVAAAPVAKVAVASKALFAAALISTGAAISGGLVYWRMAEASHTLEARIRQLEAEKAQPPSVVDTPKPPDAPSPAIEIVAPRVPKAPHTKQLKEVPVVAGPDSLTDENGLIERARTALLRRDPSAALDALDQHQRSHPTGRLSEERDAIRIQVLVQLERRGEALNLAGAFRSKYPGSLLLPSVEAAIDSAP